MKNVFKKSILSLATLVLVFSCSQENDIAPMTESTELSEVISDNLNSIADGLRANKQTFTNTELVAELGKKNLENKYGINSDAVSSYSQAFKSVGLQNARTNEDLNLSVQANQFVSLIKESSTSSKHLKAYKEKLTTIDEDISSSGLAKEEKNILRVQIISLQTSLTFVAANFDLFHPEAISNGRSTGCDDNQCTDEEQISEESESWWDDWGKCAAGTIGGVLTGGLGGAAIGSAVPVVGTITGGVVGAIGGGLTGAAAAC